MDQHDDAPEPIDALREIAFRLEREFAPSFKVKAFRTAIGILSGLDDVPGRLADGRLRRTKGIGDTTFGVIREASEGVVPSYLQKLRDRAEPLSRPVEGDAMRIRGDLHSHSEWSDGTTSIEAMAAAARWLGRDYLALTDHSPSLKIANGLDADRLRDQLDEVARVNDGADGFRLLAGIEVDILESGALDQSDELLDRLDIVVASVHSKLRADSATMTERVLAGVAHPRTSVLGHCTGQLVSGPRGTRPRSEFDAERVFAACAEAGVAVEINSRPERQDPPDELIAVALAAGCLFSIDSDAHAPGHLDVVSLGVQRAVAAGIPPERVVTTWPLDRLLDWARR